MASVTSVIKLCKLFIAAMVVFKSCRIESWFLRKYNIYLPEGVSFLKNYGALHIISLKQGIKYGNLALILCCLLSDEWFRKYRYKKNGQTPKIIWLPEPVHALEVE